MLKFIIVLLAAFAVILSMASGGKAQDSKSSAMDEVFDFAFRPQSEYTADFRATFAQTLANYCEEVLESLPTNTPAEEAWVTSEENTRDGAKIQRLLKSKEYSRSVLKSTFSECKDTARVLIELIRQFPKTNGSSETFSRLEANQFIKLALNFDVFLETYSSNVDMKKEVKLALDDLHLHVIRVGILRAAREALQDSVVESTHHKD